MLRIKLALFDIINVIDEVVSFEAEAPPAAPAAKPKPATPPPPVAATPAPPPSPAVPPAPTGELTKTQVNQVLIEEFKRVGNRELIDGCIKSFGATGVSDLNPSHYAELIDKVKAL